MAERPGGALLQLRKLLDTHAAQELTDGQLLTRFAAQRDESAFAALMKRHGPLVYGVCRHVLGHEQDAEDAFQGTFLVLAKKARTIRSQSSLAGWLHGVAYRLSLKARQSAARRRNRENRAARTDVDQPSSHEGWRELQAILDEELERLPDKYRTPFILCVLEDKTKTEAAQQLGWREGTVSSRLARARKLMQVRLARRGVELSAVLCGLAVAQKSAQASLALTLSANTLRAATAFALGKAITDGAASADAIALADGLLRSMALSRVKHGLAVAALLVAVGATTASYFWRPHDDEAPSAAPPQLAAAEAPQAAAGEPARDGPGPLVLRGKVTGADGKRPVPGASLAVLVEENRQPGDREFHVFTRRKVVAATHADKEGQFQLAIDRPVVGLAAGIQCLARGLEHTVAWQSVRTLIDPDELTFELETGQEVRGRLIDAQGRPAAGVKLRVGGFRQPSPGSVSNFPDDVVTPAWPAPAVTAADGSFTFHGMPPRTTVQLEVEDERFGPQWIAIDVGTSAVDAGPIQLEARRILEGTVVANDTGKPLASAIVVVSSSKQGAAGVRSHVSARTNAAGRFSLMPYPGDSLSITVGGAHGTPFLAAQSEIKWPEAATRHTLELRLPRGILIQGRVVEHETDRPVAGARIQYRPMSAKNEHGHEGNLLVLWPWLDVASDAEGRFEIAVLPGKGHLLVRGPGHEYVPLEVSERELIYGFKGGGRPHFPDALVRLNLAPGKEPPPIVAALRRGVTLTGRALRADGQPVASGFLLSRTYIAQGWESHSQFLPVRDGRFEIPGCDPDATETYWFWDHKALQGARVELSAKDPDKTVRLAPFGSASVRFVDDKGNVLRKPPVHIYLLVRAGLDHVQSWSQHAPLQLTRIADFQGISLDPVTGIITAKALIPDAQYIIESSTRDTATPAFTAPSGEHIRLSDVVVAPPRRPKQR